MTEKDFIDLLFRPSFSTADKISDVSGRGVGLDVVKTKIESLGGSIEAKTVKGEGSTFTIQTSIDPCHYSGTYGRSWKRKICDSSWKY